MSSTLQHSLCLAVGRPAVGKEHRAKLTTDEVESRIFKWQRQSIRLAPLDAMIRSLPRGGIVEHRLVEVGYDIICAGSEFWRQCAGDDARARGDFQNGGWRKGRCALCKVGGIWRENQRHHIAVVVFWNRTTKHLVGFQHSRSSVLCLMIRD